MATSTSANLENRRIFLIEDDVLNIAVINRVLINSKASVFQNYNSIGIITHIIQHLPIDLILLDIMLRRGVNGFDVALEIKENSHTRDIPIVAISSLDPELAIPRARTAGLNGFISKPINSVTFCNDLAAIMDGEKRWITGR